MTIRSLVEPFECADWTIEDWSIKFILSDRLLTHARKQSTLSNWHEDPLIGITWDSVISICFRSVETYYKNFHGLPVVGDRLFDEDTGWVIRDRSIDGYLRTVTFTLDS